MYSEALAVDVLSHVSASRWVEITWSGFSGSCRVPAVCVNEVWGQERKKECPEAESLSQAPADRTGEATRLWGDQGLPARHLGRDHGKSWLFSGRSCFPVWSALWKGRGQLPATSRVPSGHGSWAGTFRDLLAATPPSPSSGEQGGT